MTTTATHRIVPGAPGLVTVCRSFAQQGLEYTVGLAKGLPVVSDNISWNPNPSPKPEFHFEIHAHGRPRPSKPKPDRIPKVSIGADLLTLEQCQKGLHYALKVLGDNRLTIQARWRAQWKPEAYYGRQTYSASRDPKRLAIGKAVAKIIARHKTKSPYQFTQQDYRELDVANGLKVRRESALPGHYKDKASGYLTYIVGVHAHGNFYPTQRRLERCPLTEREQERKNLGFAGCKPWYPQDHVDLSPVEQFQAAKAEVEYWQELVRLARGGQ